MSANDKDLIAAINSQQEQLNRYKQRLQDVVVAHKKLISEKERLEETLKTVTLAKSLDNNSDATLNHSDSKLEEKIKTMTSSITRAKKLQDVEVENTKTQLNLESHQRELELTVNIRELQKIISNEKKKRENRETMVEKLKDQMKETEEKYNASKDNENELRSQLNEVKRQLESESATTVIMEELKRELQFMKEQLDSAVQQEQIRALKAEERTRKLTVEHENRVSKLEQKLAQLSNLASEYDKFRQDDQQMIMKLKNRLMQLEIETSNVKCEDDRISVNAETLIQQLQHIKHQLIRACKTSNQLNNIREILLDGMQCSQRDDPKDYKQMYIKLKQQIEAQKADIDLNPDNTAVSKQKIHSLKSRILELELLNSQILKKVEEERENNIKTLEEDRKVWKSKLNILESDYRNRLIDMESELEKQRERVTGILDEKEKQLQHLQQHYFPIFQFSEDASSNTKKSNKGVFRRQSSTLIYYIEDVARKEVEINRLRKMNNELQLKIHDMGKKHLQQVQLYTQLQEDIKRLEKQRDGTEELNTHYLKNVFLNYLMTTDFNKRSHMLNAVFAILKFSDLERNHVVKQQK